MSHNEYGKTINEFKKICSVAQDSLNNVSKRIKNTDDILKKNLNGLLVKSLTLDYLKTDNFKLWWHPLKNKLYFENEKFARPLIECPFEIRNMIVEEDHLTNFIKMINTRVSEHNKNIVSEDS